MFLARDRIGQKPLFFRHVDDAFWFGSTIQIILDDDAVPVEPDLDAIKSYLNCQYAPRQRRGSKVSVASLPASTASSRATACVAMVV